jgi:hypothetical protein
MPRPRWSGRFILLWSLSAAAVVVCFSLEELWRDSTLAGAHMGLGRLLSGGGWSSILSALLVGFLIAISLRSARWVLRAATGWLEPQLAALAGPPLTALHSTLWSVARLTSLADGWSSRGPPLHQSVAASVS